MVSSRFAIARQGTGCALAVAAFGAGLALAVAGCGNRQRENHEPPRDAKRGARVIEPSTDRVGPLPPYAIKAEGVGPYKLGERLSDLLEKRSEERRVGEEWRSRWAP